MFGDFVAIATPVAMPTHAQHPHLAPAFSTPNLSTSAINNGNAASPDFFAAQSVRAYARRKGLDTPLVPSP